MKYSIYFYDGFSGSEEMKNMLLVGAVSSYCDSRNIEFEKALVKVERSEKGKPHIPNLPLHFNVSHSGQLWICIIGPQECGIDLQIVKQCEYEKISERYFNRLEKEYVERNGIYGFFEIWTRREAYGKFTGDGFFGKKPSFVGSDMMLSERVGDGYLKNIEIAEDIPCVYCIGGKKDEIEFFG